MDLKICSAEGLGAEFQVLPSASNFQGDADFLSEAGPRLVTA